MPCRIKICGITRLEDALTAVDLGVDALGFVFVEASPRCVSVAQVETIMTALPPFVTSVALFQDATPQQVRTVVESLPFDLLQFHGHEASQDCVAYDRPYIKAIPMGSGVDVNDYAGQYPQARGFLLDSHVLGGSGGSGHTFDWKKIPADFNRPLILAGGLSVANVKQAVTQVRPYGVDVSSGVEASKGIKDPEKMAAFIQAVREGDEINANNS